VIDVEAEILKFLARIIPLMAVVGTRIYAGTDVPAVGYKPSDGPCICFKVRGGRFETEQRDLIAPSVQFKCYGATELEANRCYRTLHDVLDLGRGATMRYALAEGPGQLLQDQERDKAWWFTLVFYTMWMDDS